MSSAARLRGRAQRSPAPARRPRRRRRAQPAVGAGSWLPLSQDRLELLALARGGTPERALDDGARGERHRLCDVIEPGARPPPGGARRRRGAPVRRARTALPRRPGSSCARDGGRRARRARTRSRPPARRRAGRARGPRCRGRSTRRTAPAAAASRVRAASAQPTAQPTRRGLEDFQGASVGPANVGEITTRARSGAEAGSGWTVSWREPSGDRTSGASSRSGARSASAASVSGDPSITSTSGFTSIVTGARTASSPTFEARPKPMFSSSSIVVTSLRSRATCALRSLDAQSTTTTWAVGRWRATESSSAASSRSDSCDTVTRASGGTGVSGAVTVGEAIRRRPRRGYGRV